MSDMLLEIVNVQFVPKYHGWLLLRFNNDELRLVDIRPSMKGILTKLDDPEFFRKVFVDHEAGTIAWPGDLHLDPDTLYERSYNLEEILVDFSRRNNLELA